MVSTLGYCNEMQCRQTVFHHYFNSFLGRGADLGSGCRSGTDWLGDDGFSGSLSSLGGGRRGLNSGLSSRFFSLLGCLLWGLLSSLWRSLALNSLSELGK